MLRKMIVILILWAIIISGAPLEYASDNNANQEIRVIVNPPEFRDQQSFNAICQKAQDMFPTSKKVAYLENEIPKDPRVFSCEQIIKVLEIVFLYPTEKIKLLNLIQNYIYELSTDEVISILNNMELCPDQLLVLDIIADFLSDTSEENKQKIINHFVYSDDQHKAKDILDHLKARSKIYGTIKEKVCIFVIDVSPSMWWTFTTVDGSKMKRIDFVKQQLIKSIKGQLEPYQNFNIIIFGQYAQKWNPDVVSANDQNIDSALKWILNADQIGGTNISCALASAIGTNSDLEAIYLLSDGVPNSGITTIKEIDNFLQDKEKQKLLQGKPKFKINVVGFTLGGEDSESEKIQAQKYLESIAITTNGSFRKFND